MKKARTGKVGTAPTFSFKKWEPSLLFSALAMVVSLTGCQTTTPAPSPEAQKLRQLERQVATDPQAQSALRSINTALGAQHTVKYCPVDGQRFSSDMEECPVHHVKLKWVE